MVVYVDKITPRAIGTDKLITLSYNEICSKCKSPIIGADEWMLLPEQELEGYKTISIACSQCNMYNRYVVNLNRRKEPENKNPSVGKMEMKINV